MTSIDRQFAAARVRIRAQIRRDHRAALERLGYDPDAVERAERERLAREHREAWADLGAGFARAAAELANAWLALADGFARAVQQEARDRSTP